MSELLIREGRMGAPKAFKTGAVVGSYPKPMFVFEGDEGGLDVITGKDIVGKHGAVVKADDSTIKWYKENEIDTLLSLPVEQVPVISAFNFAPLHLSQVTPLSDEYGIIKDPISFPSFNKVGNKLLNKRVDFPFRTVVVDPITVLEQIIYGHLAGAQPGQLADPRKWASSIGTKVAQTMTHLAKLPCHVVFLLHSTLEKNETTGEIIIEPMLYSRFREIVGAVLSQFLYAEVKNGKAQVTTQPKGFVKGVGCRWPHDLPVECGATFNDIYGKVLKP